MGFESRRYKTQLFRYLYITFLMLLVGYSIYLAYFIIFPFLTPIIVAVVLTVIFYPVHTWILRRVTKIDSLAAGMSTLAVVMMVLLPVFFLLLGIVEQGIQSFAAINSWLNHVDFDDLAKQVHFQPYLDWLHQKFPFVDFDALDIQSKVMDISKNVGQRLLSLSTRAVADTASLGVAIFFTIVLTFCFLRDGRDIIQRLRYLAPLRTHQEDSIIDSLQTVMKSFLLGTLLVAGLQGIAGGIGMSIVGIPGLFWGTVMAFCSLIPVVGSSIIWLPAAGYLVVSGDWKSALFLVLWGAVGIASIDTFLRPYFLRNASKVSTFYIFLSILGGMNAFGPIGILYGPLILSFLLVMLNIYGEEFHDSLSSGFRDDDLEEFQERSHDPGNVPMDENTSDSK